MHKEGCWMSLRAWMLTATLLAIVMMGGCAKVTIKPKGQQASTRPPVAAEQSEPPSSETTAPHPSLSSIVNHDLQNGRYAEGEKALRRYLKEHPGDHSAQFFLRQLTEDPKQALGAASTPHVVQTGESYSTLAAKYLGDPNLFVVLARYNGSTNPALIHTGATLQLPASRSTASVAPAATDDTVVAPVAVPPTAAAPIAAGSTQRAQQLENQSVALYRQGRTEQALALFDQALTLNPQLKSSDPNFAALSKAWVANSHQQAMVLYLDQHLDQAIALWNRILTVDPGYEPAVVYRTRALELKQRLQQY
jgi:tetratricopeptide (TPR) repeat protein